LPPPDGPPNPRPPPPSSRPPLITFEPPVFLLLDESEPLFLSTVTRRLVLSALPPLFLSAPRFVIFSLAGPRLLRSGCGLTNRGFAPRSPPLGPLLSV